MGRDLTRESAIEEISNAVKEFTNDFSLTFFRRKIPNKATITLVFILKIKAEAEAENDELFKALMKLEKSGLPIRPLESEIDVEKNTPKDLFLIEADISAL